MWNIGALLHGAHRRTAKVRTFVRLAVRVRNQTNCVIALHLGEDPNPSRNGEFLLLRQIAPSCRSFADVGANVGDWSAYLMERREARGTLFEPVPSCVVELRARFGNAATVEAVAISDQAGELQFIEAVYSAHSSALSTFNSTIPSRSRLLVPCTTLDEYFGDRECVDVVKIDTEGYDLRVLHGARRLLSEKRIRFVQFEYNSHWLDAGSSLKAAYSYLDKLGYRVFLIRSDGLYELDREFWGEYLRYSNYFACRPQDLDIVKPLLRGVL